MQCEHPSSRDSLGPGRTHRPPHHPDRPAQEGRIRTPVRGGRLHPFAGRPPAAAHLHRITHREAVVAGSGRQDFVAPQERLMSSLSRRYRSAQPDRGEYLPPNLRSFGAAPFGAPQRARLSTWLGEAGWPRGHMELAELEGFLVALIAWPVDISSGAWLPLIWG